MLNPQQFELYSRNILLNEIGEAGQQKLLQSKILVIGAGGLGSSLLQYLVCAGVGNIGIIDNDKVELSNLQRQIIHDFSKLNIQKVHSAEEKLRKLNPDLNLNIESSSLPPTPPPKCKKSNPNSLPNSLASSNINFIGVTLINSSEVPAK